MQARKHTNTAGWAFVASRQASVLVGFGSTVVPGNRKYQRTPSAFFIKIKIMAPLELIASSANQKVTNRYEEDRR